MIISRTPFRISFFGGGTDYPEWYHRHGGKVIATTIDKYCYLACRYYPPFFDHRFRISYIRSENCKSIDEISHPAVRGVLQHLGWERGLEIHHVADLPARGGMGSSSSFTVGLLNALTSLQGGMLSKQELAEQSVHIEQEILQETVGSQDQTSAAFGGFNEINFYQDGEIAVRPLTLSHERARELQAHLMLFYTGIKRTASGVAQSYVKRIEEKKALLEPLAELVDEAVKLLYGHRDIEEFGTLLHEAWRIKRAFSGKVTNPEVDAIYEAAREAGALGGKILGAGGGGFMVLFVPPTAQESVREKLREFIHVPFRFERHGSQIVFFDREQDFASLDGDRRSGLLREFRELDVAYP
jgi:D-glycero-alpha-D-manno-heptose-7-phosphate kinase